MAALVVHPSLGLELPVLAPVLGDHRRHRRAVPAQHVHLEHVHEADEAAAILRHVHLLRAPGLVGRIARAAGLDNVISFDMGGTTAKAAIVEGGEPATTTEYEVGAGINISSKLVKGGGYAIKLPFIDVSEIGAGGGSIVSIDGAGALRVGPRSAGSVPGPACYGQGGEEPTFTDAAVVLGYLNPRHLAGDVPRRQCSEPPQAGRSRPQVRPEARRVHVRAPNPAGTLLH
jgi:hypothetical protein